MSVARYDISPYATDSPLLHMLTELKNNNDEESKVRAAKSLSAFVEAQSREMSGENYKRWMKALLKDVWALIYSPVVHEKIGGLIAVDELIDVAHDDTSILANYLRIGLQYHDTAVMTLAAKALGHLSRINSTFTTECVEFDMQRALEWLQGERYHHAACLVLKELAINTPTLFYGYVSSFVDLIWAALRDPKPAIRECAGEALGACLEVISERESRFRVQWYQKILEEAQKGFQKLGSSPEAVHASLLAVGELLRNTGDFLKDRYVDISHIVLRYKDNRDKFIRKAVILLLPRLAVFAPEKFANSFLPEAVQFLLFSLKKDVERGNAFVALGEVAMVVGKHILPFLDSCVAAVKAGLTPKAKSPSLVYLDAIACISMLARAVGTEMLGHIREGGLLDQMFAEGLSQTLTDSLADLAKHIPTLAQEIQERLLDLLSVTLADKPFNYPGTPHKYRKKNVIMTPTSTPQTPKELDSDKAVALALNILGSFNFSSGLILTEFLRESVVHYLQDSNLSIRKEAVICCCKLMGNSTEQHARAYHSLVVSEVLEKLLSLAITDPEPTIRASVLASLDSRFDRHLTQAANLRALFTALNDETFRIREVALQLICHLAPSNPAYVMPELRTTLIQLLTELEYSGDNTTKESSSKLLGILIKSTSTIVQPYIEPLMKALLPKLRDADAQVSSGVLATVGELSVVSGESMMQHMPALMPLIIDTLQDQSSHSKREVAIRTLGLLAESTGYVIEPFIKYPRLLDTILNEIQIETSPAIRKEVIKVFGILGALDPYKHKLNQLLLEGRQDEEMGTGKTQKTSDTKEVDVLANLSPSNEDYYPAITIAALMRILRDPSLNQYHTLVIHALMVIVKAMGMKSVQFLPQIMPPYMSVMRTCEPEFRALLFQQLGQLVSKVKQHVREYLADIFQLIRDYWNVASNIVHIITLIEEVSLALGDEFRPNIPEFLPQLLQILHTDGEPNREATSKVLHSFRIFGTNLDDYLHLVVPAIIKLAEHTDLRIRIQCLQTLNGLLPSFNLINYASRILHPLSRILDAAAADGPLQKEAMLTLNVAIRQLGSNYMPFVATFGKIIGRHHIVDAEYDALVGRVVSNSPFDGQSPNSGDSGPKSADANPEENLDISNMPRRIALNKQNLKRAWEVSQRSTKEDWIEWLRNFSVVLLRESPSPALRACISLANDYHAIVKELFNAGFVSCWSELPEQYQDELIRSLETALASPNVPLEILQTILNLAEFMEQDEKPLPIDPRTLGQLAEKCHAYAKALHYKEMEYKTSPVQTIEALISINNQLQQPEAALGVLTSAQKNLNTNVELKETWYEKLQRWELALVAYEKKYEEDPLNTDYALGRMRCLHALSEWEKLDQFSQDMWRSAPLPVKQKVAPLAAASAWNLANWDLMPTYIKTMQKNSVDGGFFRAVLAIHNEEYDKAQRYIDLTRDIIDTKLTALVGESYSRAYKFIVRVQQLAELEEIISFKQQPSRRKTILAIWNDRLQGCERNIDTWKSILTVRSLVLSPIEDMHSWLKFAALCRKSRRLDLSNKTLVHLLGSDPAKGHLSATYPRVSFAYIKQLWDAGSQKKAHMQLKQFTPMIKEDTTLLARMYLKLGQWQTSLEGIDEANIPSIINSYSAAIKYDGNWYKAWHAWALANYEAISFYEKGAQSHKRIGSHLVPAIKGFFRSIALAPPHKNLQDTLRLLTLWFKHGSQKEVEAALSEGFNNVRIDTWLQVIPQIIARIHAPVVPVRRLIDDLLTTIGKAHPQALVYPLTVASKSQSNARIMAAVAIMNKMREHSANLVEQAQLVSNELIRVSILWHEMWHEGLEEASRTYFADHNTEAMLATLRPLHEMLEKGPETLREVSFQQAYGRDLQEAFEWCKKWERSHKQNDYLNQAWEMYYRVFRRIMKQIPQMTTLELQHVSPKLLEAKDLEIAVPGTYRAGQPVVPIKSFNPTLHVITSKQRPRKLIINGMDGFEYMFLLKGHEDLRQDERVMQLFGLVNTLLSSDYETSKNHLNIQRYSVMPLSPNSGLIGWVPHSDTLHQLIRDYRDSRKIPINIEHKLMLQMAPDYENMTLMQKVEAFEFALDSTNGQDLERILWLKSSNSEAWLDRRTNYTRSLAVMSMVGYILGLGDRHPSNLMLDRLTGKVLHIDFGDCFEVAMHREKYPEKIPFRLTRMLINSMEVSGIEGTFRLTCENVMRVLRDNKESLMAVLEAFVYDPIINWRLLTPNSPDLNKTKPDNVTTSNMNQIHNSHSREVPELSTSVSKLPSADAMPEILNRRALQVINRVSKKLTGRDFGTETLDIPEQIQRLINQATSHENLCQCYIGWCPFW
eukprot:TRINITY_DN21_c0_g2_i1.p1 TRINITY_DN21_c0_g2~~TRINITY_DN21_c0_g2_i1.p1  ORF type:complete len:2332 (-),score=773.36 TRINITY_DN21_c0_g2_i1:268-7263(-)